MMTGRDFHEERSRFFVMTGRDFHGGRPRFFNEQLRLS